MKQCTFFAYFWLTCGLAQLSLHKPLLILYNIDLGILILVIKNIVLKYYFPCIMSFLKPPEKLCLRQAPYIQSQP